MVYVNNTTIHIIGFHLENCQRGGKWSNLDFKGDMMVKDVTKFHKHHLGIWSILECVCMQGFIQGFEFWEGRAPKLGVDVEGVYST